MNDAFNKFKTSFSFMLLLSLTDDDDDYNDKEEIAHKSSVMVVEFCGRIQFTVQGFTAGWFSKKI